MCPAAAIAVPAAVSILGGIMGSKSAKKQAAAAAAAAERGRQASMAALSPSALKGNADWIFPGLLPSAGMPGGATPAAKTPWTPGPMGPSPQIPARLAGSANPLVPRLSGGTSQNVLNPAAGGMGALGGILSGIAGRAEGGPVSGGKPYMVGEEGPEIITPKRDGMVIPNGGQQQPPSVEDDEAMEDPADEGADGDEHTQQLLQLIIQLLTHVLGPGPGGAQAGGPPMPGGEGEAMGAPPPMLDGARAGGGPIAAGGSYLTGERGPETVVPRPAAPGQVAGPAPPSTTAGANPAPAVPTGYLPPPPPALANPTGGATPGVQMAPGTFGPSNPANPTASQAMPSAGPPAAGGTATATAHQTNAPPSYGASVVGQNQGLIDNPGQISSIGYERAQEQINQGLATGARGVTGGLTAGGIDPNTPMGQALMASVTATAGKQRNEAARDYTLAEEAMRRQDIATATQAYINMLTTLFGYQQNQAAAAGGTAFPQVPVTQSGWNVVGNAAGQLAQGFADKYAKPGGGGTTTNTQHTIGTGPP